MQGLQWVFSIVLVVVFVITGVIKVFRYEKAGKFFPWVNDMPRALAQAIGIFEILGGLGLILPVATGIYPWLTPVAAVVLALLQFMAAWYYVARGEKSEVFSNVLLLILLAIVAYIRWPLMP